MFNHSENWTLDYFKFNPEKEKHSEALCSIGNGYFCTRGAFEEACTSEISYPGTYVSGLYNRLESKIGNRIIENEDLVKCPNWLCIDFRIGDGDWFDISKVEILYYHKQLDLKHGVLLRKVTFKDTENRITTIKSKRFASMASPHYGAMNYNIIPKNYSDTFTIKSTLDGDVINEGVDRYRQLNSRHIETIDKGVQDNNIFLLVRTNNSKINIAEASKCTVLIDGKQEDIEFKYLIKNNRIERNFSVLINDGETLSIEKIVTIFTSKDCGVSNALSQAKESLRQIKRYEELYFPHVEMWKELWEKADIEVDGDNFVQKVIRLHMFHIIITASIHSKDLDTSIPARGLHGEAYRGHIFWDELFVLPLYYLHFPEIAKSILMYRYRRLNRAREYAHKHGYKGAMFPWQSESDGREGSQVIHFNPVSGIWEEDNSSLQGHVSGAIVYNVWHYYMVTADLEFIEKYGAELIFEIARFWSSKARFNEISNRYEIENIMGPDEYHEKYPNSAIKGLKNNAYTNILIVWVIERALKLLNILPQAQAVKLKEKIELDEKEIERWKDITKKMKLTIHSGIVSQFEGFCKLKELDWDSYKAKYDNTARLDRILKAEGDSPDNYKMLKQADFLMIFYLFRLEDIKNIFKKMNYNFTDDMLKKNYVYYLSRTSHGSTLSPVVHSYLANLVNDKEKSLELFYQSLKADIDDIQCGTTEEGIHLGLMGGTINIMLASYAGLDIRNGLVQLDPNLPEKWDRIKFNFLFRGLHYFVEIFKSKINIVFRGDADEDIRAEVWNKIYKLKPEKMNEIYL